MRPADKSAAGSKIRTQFNNLVKQLENERQRLAGWHDALPVFRARRDSELKPLYDLHGQRMRAIVVLLDDAWQHKKLTKREREKLSDMICTSCEMLFSEDGDDDSLDEIYARHIGIDEELLEEPEVDPSFKAFAEMLDGMFENFGAPDGEDEDDGAHGAGAAAHGPGARRAPPGKPSAKEKRVAAEELRLQQSVREIFRKLVSTLHPDRETDPAERVRKTALMQRVNVAYEKNDLLGLLELQFEIDQIDTAGLEALGDDRIKQYNKMLKKQVDDVRREIMDLENWIVYDLGIFVRRVSPKHLDDYLASEVRNVKDQIRGLEKDLCDFEDLKRLKLFLKAFKLPKRDEYFDGDFF